VDKSRQFAQELEWSNYARAAYFARVVPGVEVTISNEVILIADPEVPLVDGNHAAMLQTAPERADALIEHIVRHFRDRGVKPYVVLSPNCVPDDLGQRLEEHGFTQFGNPEHWLTLEKPFYAEAIRGSGKVTVREIGFGLWRARLAGHVAWRAPQQRGVCAGCPWLSGLEEGRQQSDGLSDRAAQDGSYAAHRRL
jgi:hypothetical protein